LTRAEADEIVGYIAHECCHVLHTDKRAWQRAVKSGQLVQHLTNAIEDVRIEAKEIAAGYLPNLRNVLSATLNAKHWDSVQGRNAKNQPAVGAHPADVPYAICVLGRLANGYTVPAATRFQSNIRPDLRPIVQHALDRLPGLASADGSLALAREIARKLERLARKANKPAAQPPANKPDSRPQGGQGGSQEAQDDQGGSQGSQEAQDDQGGSQGSQEAQDDQGGSQGSQEAQDGQEAGKGAGGPDSVTPIDPNLGAERLVAARKAQGDRADRQDVAALNEYRGTDDVYALSSQRSAQAYEAMLRTMLDKPGVLRSQIARLVRSQERHGRDRFRSVGRLDRRALGRMAAGATNVYTKRTLVPGVDTAVILLVDGSASMQDTMRLAHLLALHLAEACEAARAKVAIVGFYGSDVHVRLAIAKGFADRHVDCTRLANLTADTSTPLSAGILAATDMFRGVHADRNILLVLTDGMCDLRPACVTQAIGMASRRGVECAGIGIQTDVSMFPINTTVHNPQAIATEGLTTLVQALKRGARR
jgi:hypothetical protein